MKSASEQLTKALKLFRFLALKPRTYLECIGNEDIDISRSTFYRLLGSFEEAGFVIEKKHITSNRTEYGIKMTGYIEEILHNTSEKALNETITPKRKYSKLAELIDSPYLRKKPFIEALYGEYKPHYGTRLKNKIDRYCGNKFNDEEIRIIITVLEALQTHIDYLLT